MMKKTILLLVAALCGVLTAAAQDLIVKTDATKVEAKVTEITPDAVRYKRFSNPDGPTYVLPVADIDYIQYANGEKERFRAAETVPATPLTPATPVGEAPVAAAPAAQAPVQQAAPVQYVAKEYQIGEFYDQNGVKGVVCMLTEDRRHGLIISLDQIYQPSREFTKHDLPAIDELLTIGHNYNGGTRIHSNRQARNRFNDALKDNGGKRMDRLVYYFSSTEKDEKEAYTTHTGIEPPYVIEIPKYNKFLVRAVRKF